MVVNVSDVLSAYRQGGGLNANTGASAQSTAENESFSSVLKKYAGDTVDALKEGEKAAAQGATGKSDLASVVTAINNAEMLLQTVVTIRDKVITAYQDIVKTQI